MNGNDDFLLASAKVPGDAAENLGKAKMTREG